MKKEKFEIGDKVFLIHLQQEGVVKRWTGTEYLYVVVDGDEIPVAISDVSKEIPSLKKEALAMPPEEYRPAPEPPRNRVSETGDSSFHLSRFTATAMMFPHTTFTSLMIHRMPLTATTLFFFTG